MGSPRDRSRDRGEIRCNRWGCYAPAVAAGTCSVCGRRYARCAEHDGIVDVLRVHKAHTRRAHPGEGALLKMDATP